MSTLLQITNLSKAYGPHVILDKVNLNIIEKQKIGVFGRNGAGKSTLFKIIIGEEEFDSGTVNIHDIARLGYLEQNDPFEEDEIVMDFLQRYSEKEEWRCAKVASQFQLNRDQLYNPVTDLSGGYQMRVKLSAMLLKEPNLLLLDEPTNYLDLKTLILLEKFLQSYNSAFLIISHDREFLKNTCNETLEVDQGDLVLYPRPIEEYLEFKQEQTRTKQAYNKKVGKQQQHLQKFVDRFRYQASKASQAQNKIKQIDRLNTVNIKMPEKTARIHIPTIEDKKGLAIRIEELSIGYSDKTVATEITHDIERGEHIAIVGDNGQGKSTYIKTIIGEIDSLSGQARFMPNIRVGYYAQHLHAMLNSSESVEQYLERVAGHGVSREEILATAGSFLFDSDGISKTIQILSGGEKARLCLAGLLLQKNNFLVLDEPTNHLDFETVEALGNSLSQFNGTILFISHNRTFVNMIATAVIEVKNGSVKRYNNSYEEYVASLSEPENDTESSSKNTTRIKIQSQKDQIKKFKQQISKLDKKVQQYEEEKTKLHKYFENNPVNYSQKKAERLTQIERLIKRYENEWMEVEEEIQKLEG
ncbi:ABC-F family ATP-binding cassette domain-containing protein [Candidatus Falkowbacteria bacterium]|nr:ABC-F family ATP-binding cassette domain-containing protein [Candidatus Falkowbacteria bacterium]